jgi:hypothetical protein
VSYAAAKSETTTQTFFFFPDVFFIQSFWACFPERLGQVASAQLIRDLTPKEVVRGVASIERSGAARSYRSA